ncbi:hypothetical protein AN641_10120 [Candidatus Epulonipiscioides gigas]|nr:hypothetical protein AN641_10120 [Epulopiscium sp. SCG-C07WGA-EpuloA2]
MKKKFSILILGALLFQPMSSINNTYAIEQTDLNAWISHPAIVGGSIKFNYKTGAITDADDTIIIANIPEKINGVIVSSIDKEAFAHNNKLISVTIPDTITSIGESAFSNCYQLETVTMSNAVTFIGDNAFGSCYHLIDIVIPNNVDFIGNYAFNRCHSLTSITIPSSVSSIGIGAFFDCENLTTIAILNGVSSIGDSAFSSNNNLTDISIPTSVIYNEQNIFGKPEDIKLKIVYYEGVREQWESLKTGITRAAIIYNSNLDLLNDWIQVEGIEGGQIQFDKQTGTIINAENSVYSVNIPSHIEEVEVRAIGNHAFSDCDKLTSVTMPLTIDSIGDFAFYSCDNLENITLPQNLTSIGYNAFGYNPSLSEITIPSSVTYLDNLAFVYTNIDTINYTGSKEQWETLEMSMLENTKIIFEALTHK